MKRLFVWLETIINKHKELKRWKRIVTALAAVITFATTYALILPAITVERNNTEEVAGMYLEQEDAGTSKEQAAGTHRELEGGQDDLLLENALEFTGVSIAADQENAVTFEYADDGMTATAIFSTDEEIPEGSELVVNSVDPESEEYAALGSRAAALLDREFIYDVTTCSFYDFALISDGVDVTPKTGLVDVQIVFNDNTVEHVDDVVFAGRFARRADETDGFMTLEAGDVGAEPGAIADPDTTAEIETLEATEDHVGSEDQTDVKDELVSANPDESAAIELTDGIIRALTIKGNDLAESDSLVGLLAGYVDEEAKAEAAETDAAIPDPGDVQDSEGEGDSPDLEEGEVANAPDVKTLKASGSDYSVVLTYDETSKIPEGAYLTASEIAQDSKEYQTYLEQTKKAMGLKEEETLPRFAARFFDIKIMVGGEEFIPESGVSVEITYAEPLAEKDDAEVSAVHFADEKAKPEVIEANTTEVQDDGTATVEFVAESFSVYGVIYTVDFHYEVDGMTYSISIPGGSYVSLSSIIELLGIAKAPASSEIGNTEDAANNDSTHEPVTDAEELSVLTLDNLVISEATKQFMNNVDDVVFSNPDLVWIEKVIKTTTVGALKDRLRLECEYSSELTEMQIAKINATKIDAGEWALISLKPFDTEETMTVTMKNGDVFEVKVTDAVSDAPTNNGVVQTISNPSGTTMDLFDYWIDDSLKNSKARAAWPGNYRYPNGPSYTDYGQFDYYDRSGNYMCDYNGVRYDQYGNAIQYNVDRSSYLLGNGNNRGINNNHNFKFTPGVQKTVIDGTLNNFATDRGPGVNSWTGYATPRTVISNGQYVGGLVEKTLDNDYPKLTTNTTLGTDGTSLAYLFNDYDSDTQNASNRVAGKKTYKGVDQLLYVDRDGYYTFDSHDFNAEFDPTSNEFSLESQVDYLNGNGIYNNGRQWTADDTGEPRGFWPFGNQVYWHGMHMRTNFSMPVDGKVLSPRGVYNDMEFEFQGDDDTWLYVDGVLIGDGGGIHNQTFISINFREGTVLVSGERDHNPDYCSTYHVELYLDDLFRAAGKTIDSDTWVLTENGHYTFKQGTNHTFDMYYLERGGGESNLRIHYNLISTTEFSAHKADVTLQNNNGRLNRDDYKFELIGYDGVYDQYGEIIEGKESNIPIMPNKGTMLAENADNSGGTADDPLKVHKTATETEPAHTSLIIGVTEDGNVNFGDISNDTAWDTRAGDVYRYKVREIIPAGAVKVIDPNTQPATTVTWAEADDEQKAEGGFVYNGKTYDSRVYYFTGTVVWDESANKWKLKKTRYLDEDYTIPDKDTTFNNFVNGLQPITLKVVKKEQGGNTRLPDAEFSLTPAKMTDVILDANNNITSCKWVKREKATTIKRTTDNNGEISFSGLTEGYYILEETAVPPGYAVNGAGKWIVKVLKQESNDSIILVPVVQALNADGSPDAGTSPETLLVSMVASTPTSAFEVLNTPNTDGIQISVKKQWQDADMTEITEGGYSAKFRLKRTKKEIVTTVQDVPANNATLRIGYYYSTTSGGWWPTTTYHDAENTYSINPNQFKASSEVTITYDYKNSFTDRRYKVESNGSQHTSLSYTGSFTVNMPQQGQTRNVYFYAGNNDNGWPLDTLTVTGVTEQPTQVITQTVSDEVDDEEFSVQPVAIEGSDVGQFTNTYDPVSPSGKFPVVKKDGNKTITYKYYIEEFEPTMPEGAGSFETIYMIGGKEVSEAEYLAHESNYPILEDASGENARTVINRKLIDIPITKVWPDYEKQVQLQDGTKKNLYCWEAKLHLDYRDIPLDDQEHPTDWKQYHLDEPDYDNYTKTLTSEQTETIYFNDLPMYVINSQGKKCRREYSVVEKEYNVWQYNETSGNYDITVAYYHEAVDENTPATVFPSDHRYTLWYEHDAGEDSNYSDDNYPSVNDYNISVYNMHENRDVKKDITVDIQKKWEGIETPPNSYKAKFRLRRKVLVEYRNYEYVTEARTTVKLVTGDGNDQVLRVPPGHVMFIRGILKEGADPEGIQFTRSDTSELLTASRDTTFAGYNLFQAEFAAPSDANAELTVTLSSAPEQISGLVVDGIKGFLLSDSNDRQSFGVDATFSREFELSNDNNWSAHFPEVPVATPTPTPSGTPTPEDPQAEFEKHLPAVEISTLDAAGNTANIYIYTYFFEEVECTPDTFYPTFTDSSGKELLGDKDHQFFNDEIIIATNRPISFEVLKVDKNTTDRVLPGAKFVFRKLTGAPPRATKGGTFAGEGAETTVTTGDSGKITFSNDGNELEPGCYYEVKETVAPSGYVLAQPLIFYLRVDEKAQGDIKLQKIIEDGESITLEDCDTTTDDGIVTATTEDEMVTLTKEYSADGRTVSFTVKNEPGAALPSTGGPGTRLFTILGAILALGAGLVLISRNGGFRRIRR